MRRRKQSSDSVPGTLVFAGWTVGAMLTALTVAMPAAGQQAPVEPSRDWVVPRTPDGFPDLQGNWTNATLTPFERAEGRGPLFTWDEVDALEGRAASRIDRVNRPSDPNRPAPPVGGDGSTGAAGGVGGYNGIYIDRGERVAIVHGEPRASLVTHPADGRRPPLTREGQRRLDEYRASRDRFGAYDHPEMRPLGERCIMSFGSSAGPPMIPNAFYNNNYTIVQSPGHVMIMAEMVHDARIIRLGDGPKLPPNVRPWMGDSRGWWEDDTLVVETTNLHPRQVFRGIPPSEHLRVIERFTRIDAETLLYEFTIDDPTTYTESWGGEIPMRKFDDRLYEYSCHEGNYALSNILSGARYQERLEARRQVEPR